MPPIKAPSGNEIVAFKTNTKGNQNWGKTPKKFSLKTVHF